MCACERERDRERERDIVRVFLCQFVHFLRAIFCKSVREKERERERERENAPIMA